MKPNNNHGEENILLLNGTKKEELTPAAIIIKPIIIKLKAYILLFTLVRAGCLEIILTIVNQYAKKALLEPLFQIAVGTQPVPLQFAHVLPFRVVLFQEPPLPEHFLHSPISVTI